MKFRGDRMPAKKPVEWLAKDYTKKRIASYKPFNFVDGEGVRCSLYVSGCLFNCKGCYNKAAQDFNYGIPYTQELEDQIITDLAEPYVQGLTCLGGEPFLNTSVLIPLCERIKKEFGDSKDIWSWTGYTWDELLVGSTDKKHFLNLLDVVVDGRFELAKKDLTKAFRGSSNQRIIDVKASFAQNDVVLYIDD